MSALYVLNIVLIYVVFRFGAGFDAALYVNMIISLMQCIINLIFAKKCFKYDIFGFCKLILVPCVIVALFVICGNVLLVRNINPSWIRVVIGGIATEISIVVLGYFLILDFVEKRKVCELVRKCYTGKLQF